MGKNPQEPDFVAGLVVQSTPFFDAAVRSLLAPSQIHASMLGVFYHQTPQVQYSKMKNNSYELEDLLFVHVNTDKADHVRRNALLYQSKVSTTYPYHLPKKEQDQLKLYMEWPSYTYVNSPPLTGESRSVTPKSAHAGGQYMLIDNNPPSHPLGGLAGVPGTFPLGSCMPDYDLVVHNNIAVELYSLLHASTGRPFADIKTTGKSSDWSRVVWDLIRQGAAKAFNRKRSGRHGTSRISGDPRDIDGAFYASATSPDTFSTITDALDNEEASLQLFTDDNSPPSNEFSGEWNDNESKNTSVVIIETREDRESQK